MLTIDAPQEVTAYVSTQDPVVMQSLIVSSSSWPSLPGGILFLQGSVNVNIFSYNTIKYLVSML